MTQINKLEGTFLIEGLVEGNLPDDSLNDALRRWERSARSAGLPLTLQFESSHFNILPDTDSVKVARLRGDLRDQLVESLDELLSEFPVGWRPGIVSTLRSREYRPGQEIQTLYVVSPHGGVLNEQRTIETATVRPPDPISRREKMMMVGASLGILALTLLVLSFFFDLKSMVTDATDSLMPYSESELVVEMGPFAPHLEVESQSVSRGVLEIVFKPKFDLVTMDAELEKRNAAAKTLRQKMAIEDLMRRHFRVTQYDRKGKPLAVVLASLKVEEVELKPDPDAAAADKPDPKAPKILVQRLVLKVPLARTGRAKRVVLQL